MNIAVIGAGAAGLITAHILQKAAMKVTVFEARAVLGGTWAYDPRKEPDTLGRVPDQQRISSSMYEGLRTNLPRKVMSFSSFPFDRAHVRGDRGEEFLTFPSHRHVLEYLAAFAQRAKLERAVRFNSPVQRLYKEGQGEWRIELKSGEVHTFLAVVICNGHYSVPYVPSLDGLKAFCGRAFHSHNYRTPTSFSDRKVVILGAKASGIDIALEVSKLAKEVHLCANAHSGTPAQSSSANIQPRPAIRSIRGASIELQGGDWIHDVDDLIFCTGYTFSFPFLDPGIVEVERGYVRPLYKELLSLKEPSLAFVGLPLQVAPFRLFEVQARYLSAAWGGSLRLPPEKERWEWLSKHEETLLNAGLPRRHWLKHSERQFKYHDMLAQECGAPCLEASYIDAYRAAHQARKLNPEGYRDESE